ncbi:MAG TPA: shikimate kinase [Spirochaetes bacterium]|nr:shikimate kinase [Spirochaetota bacterium]
MQRILIFGNSGSGKTSLSRRLRAENSLTNLDLDTIAWDKPGVRKDVDESLQLLQDFIDKSPNWIIEGCYGSLIQYATKYCTELIFLNPGIEKCLENNLKRPFEPHKFSSLEEQNEKLKFLQEWVQNYENRDDEYSLKGHREIFESFQGSKKEIHS